MITPVTKNRNILPAAVRGALVLAVLCLANVAGEVRAQSVSGVRGMSGGVGALFNLTGPGNLYADSAGNLGSMYNFGSNFESFNFKLANGQAYSGGMMTLGPQLSVGLIQGSNQSGSPLVFPPAPRLTIPVPPIQSTVFQEFQPLIDLP